MRRTASPTRNTRQADERGAPSRPVAANAGSAAPAHVARGSCARTRPPFRRAASTRNVIASSRADHAPDTTSGASPSVTSPNAATAPSAAFTAPAPARTSGERKHTDGRPALRASDASAPSATDAKAATFVPGTSRFTVAAAPASTERRCGKARAASISLTAMSVTRVVVAAPQEEAEPRNAT